MYSQDALEMYDYSAEDFQRPRVPPIQPRDPSELVGADAEWVDKYSGFFDGADDKESRMKKVQIPRYSGPKNTRLEIIPMTLTNLQTVDITGLPNHAQPTCIYLRKIIDIRVHQAPDDLLVDYFSRPFIIQRQFESILWNCPQSAQTYELHPQIQCRLAPYLCDRQMIENCNQQKTTYLTQEKAGGNHKETIVSVTVHEPLLGFQQGYALLDAIRPMNQGNKIYPLAIQDYQLTVKRYGTEERVKRMFRDPRFVTDYEGNMANRQFGGIVMYPTNNFDDANRANVMFELIESESELAIFSDDSAIQDNKNVSSIEMHAPFFQVFKNKITFTPATLPNECKLLEFYEWGAPTVPAQGDSVVKQSIILGTEGDTQPCRIACNTSKGMPSFIMVYLEMFGRNYWDPGFQQSLESPVGTDLLIGGHPSIYEIGIKIFGQEFPITKVLDTQELDYLTKKNSHPRCDFYNNMKYDPIVLLKLEDLGLATELQGYPNSKRLEMEVEIRQILMPNNWGAQYDRVANPDLPNPEITANVVFIYENHVLEGSNGSCNFVWKY